MAQWSHDDLQFVHKREYFSLIYFHFPVVLWGIQCFFPISCLQPAQGEEKAVVHMQLCPWEWRYSSPGGRRSGDVAYCAVRLAREHHWGLAVLLLLLVFCLDFRLPKTLPKEVHQ